MAPIPPNSAPPTPKRFYDFSDQLIQGTRCTGDDMVAQAACFPGVPVELVVAEDLREPRFRQFLLAHLERLIQQLNTVTGELPRIAIIAPQDKQNNAVVLPLTTMDAPGRAALFAALAPAQPYVSWKLVEYGRLKEHFSPAFHQRFILTLTQDYAPKTNQVLAAKSTQYAAFAQDTSFTLVTMKNPTRDLLSVGNERLSFHGVLTQLRGAVRNYLDVHRAVPGDQTWESLSATFAQSSEYYLVHAAALEMLPAEGRKVDTLSTPALIEQLLRAVPGLKTVQSVALDLFTRVNCSMRPEGCTPWLGSAVIYLPLLKELGTAEAQRALIRTALSEYMPRLDNSAVAGDGPPRDALDNPSVRMFTWDSSAAGPLVRSKPDAGLPPLGHLFQWATVDPEILIDELVRAEHANRFQIMTFAQREENPKTKQEYELTAFQVETRALEQALPELAPAQEDQLVRRIQELMRTDPRAGVTFYQVFRYLPAIRDAIGLDTTLREAFLTATHTLPPPAGGRTPKTENDLYVTLLLLGTHRLFSSQLRAELYEALVLRQPSAYFGQDSLWSTFANGLESEHRMALGKRLVEAYVHDAIPIELLRMVFAPLSGKELMVLDNYCLDIARRDDVEDAETKILLVHLEYVLARGYWQQLLRNTGPISALNKDAAEVVRQAAAQRILDRFQDPQRETSLDFAKAFTWAIPKADSAWTTALLKTLRAEELETMSDLMIRVARPTADARFHTEILATFAQRFPSHYHAYVAHVLNGRFSMTLERWDDRAPTYTHRMVGVALSQFDTRLHDAEERARKGEDDPQQFTTAVSEIVKSEQILPLLANIATQDETYLAVSALYRLAHLRRIDPQLVATLPTSCQTLIEEWEASATKDPAPLTFVSNQCREEITP